MKKLVVLPLDERPCNYVFPKHLGDITDYVIEVPPLSLLGQKKTKGDIPALHAWFKEAIKDADGAIIAFDTWLYSGIIPSRLHKDSIETLNNRLDKLCAIKAEYPQVKLFGFSLIMRNPSYSSSDEEPDYYEDYGREIHRKGVIEHKQTLSIASPEEDAELKTINDRLPKHYFEDYTNRRKINLALNKRIIALVNENVLDFLIIPQDDASPYGLTAIDQDVIRKHIYASKVSMKVLMYPGADEVANTLLSRFIFEARNQQPKIYIKYTSNGAKELIPLFEDRPLDVSVKYQVIAAGGVVVSSMQEADTVLIVNAPPSNMLNASVAHLRSIEYNAFRNLPEVIVYAKHALDTLNKGVMIADVAYGNGGDLEFISMLKQEGLLFKIHSYAGWNTSSNTLGTTIPHGLLRWAYGDSKAHRDFLGLRYAEDVGYCAQVRQDVIRDILPKMQLNYFKVDGKNGEVAGIVKQQIQSFVDTYISDAHHQVIIKACYMPWSRMFEVGLTVEVNHENHNA